MRLFEPGSYTEQLAGKLGRFELTLDQEVPPLIV